VSLRILHVETGRHLYGGALQVRYLLEGLAARGVANILACAADADIAEAARDYCEAVHELPMAGELDLGFAGRLRRVIRAERPDLLHIHSRRGADILGGLAAWRAGVPAVLSRRVDNLEPALWVRLKYRLFARVITISEAIRQVLLAEGVPKEKLVCVPSAVDMAAYERPCDDDWFRSTFALAPGERAVGVIAQLIVRKGHRHLLTAAPAILAACPDTRILLFGQGPLEDELRSRIRDMGLEGRVELAGFRDDLPRVLPCLDLVVHPADMEGLGVSLLQAAAAGVPLVGTRAGGLPEVIREANGVLVPPADPPALAQAVIALLKDPERARRMGEAGRALVRERFSIDAMVEGNLRVYRELLASGTGRR
jgi:glycosyltransferase involved in cell wall biosynthesis